MDPSVVGIVGLLGILCGVFSITATYSKRNAGWVDRVDRVTVVAGIAAIVLGVGLAIIFQNAPSLERYAALTTVVERVGVPLVCVCLVTLFARLPVRR